MNDSEIREKLSKIGLFASLKDDKQLMDRLVAICGRRSYPAGKVVIKEGDLGNEMFVALTGAVEIQKETRAGDSYTVVQLRAEYNVFFGEIALIDDDKRSATVMTTEDSDFLVVTKEAFLELGNKHPQIGLPITREIAKILASRLRKTTGDMLTIFDALVNEIRA